MVFDVVNGPGKRPARQSAQLVGDVRHLLAIAPTLEQQPRTGARERDITELTEEIGAAAAVDGDMGYVTEVNLRFPQAIIDRL